MRLSSWSLLLWMLALAHAALATGSDAPANPAIDMDGFLRVANETAAHRASHRLSEDEFIRMGRMPGTVILDARSVAMYEFLHVRGAINLSFPDIAIGSLAQTIPDKDTRILIYCNNNFSNLESAFATKLPSASLNLSTFIALYNYGYRNVYELAPLLDGRTTRIQFESSRPRPRT
jgi:rhodanese-like protein